MPRSRLIISLGIPAALFVAAGTPALSQGVVTEKALSLDLAQAIVQGALEKCRADGNHVSIALLDRDGVEKVIVRDEGSSPHTLTTAQRKAFTALAFRTTSAEWANRVLNDPTRAGLKEITGTIPLGGGVPIKIGNEVVGGIGVSGSPGAEKDEACANAGIQKVADQLK